MDADISAQDRFYRRGMVLGFTLAEIMVLIIFALLLATSWHLAAKDKKIDKLEAALEERIARDDDLFLELEQAKEQRDAQEKVNADLREKVETLENENKALEERATLEGCHRHGAVP